MGTDRTDLEVMDGEVAGDRIEHSSLHARDGSPGTCGAPRDGCHDWGGAVAYSYAAQFRSTVKRLAVIEMLVPGFGWEQLLTPSPNGWVWHMAFHAVPDVPEMLTAGKERAYLSFFLKTMGAYDTTAVTESDIDEYVRCYTAPGAWHAAFQYYRAWFDDVAQNEIHATTPLEMPVLAIGGSFSTGSPPSSRVRSPTSSSRSSPPSGTPASCF